jgi:hypothetical protein
MTKAAPKYTATICTARLARSEDHLNLGQYVRNYSLKSQSLDNAMKEAADRVLRDISQTGVTRSKGRVVKLTLTIKEIGGAA